AVGIPGSGAHARLECLLALGLVVAPAGGADEACVAARRAGREIRLLLRTGYPLGAGPGGHGDQGGRGSEGRGGRGHGGLVEIRAFTRSSTAATMPAAASSRRQTLSRGCGGD